MKRLEEIKKRLSEATPGPWYFYGMCGWNGVAIGSAPEPIKVTGRGHLYDGDDDFSINIIGVNCEYFEAKEPDCEFIAHSRQNIEDLVRCVEVMREALEFYCNLKSNVKVNASWPISLPEDAKRADLANQLIVQLWGQVSSQAKEALASVGEILK